jgi:transcriptional regulator with XRE-family HTH domain
MEIMNAQDFGIWLKTTRKRYGINQNYVSKESGITRANISKIENNKAPDFKFKNAVKIANVLNGIILLKDHKEL